MTANHDKDNQPVNYPAQPGYPAQPAPGYAQPQYGQPQQGLAPQQPGYPAQQPQYQQPFGQPAQQQALPPVPEMPRATLQDFYDQPVTGGGPPLKFDHPGDRYVGIVTRSVTGADVTPATNLRTGEISKHPDGRVKYVMKIPLLITPSPSFPEGIGVFYAKGNDRPELTRAMEAAGIETDPSTGRLYPPRAGDTIDITFTHEQPNGRGMNPTKVKRIVYTKGNGEPPQMPGAPMVQGQVVQSQYQQPQQGFAPAPLQQAPQAFNTGPVYQQPQFQPVPHLQAPAPPQLDPAQAYQQATGQFQPGPYGQPQAEWNPYAQQPQQFPTPAQTAPGAPPSGPVPPSGAPSPSSAPTAPDGSPWPADVQFQPGLTPAQARLAQQMNLPGAQQPPQ
jgi:hypothetical protein